MIQTETPSPAGAIARVDRILRYALAPLLLIVVADLLQGVLHGPQWIWNESRLASALSIAYGYTFYPSQHVLGPILGTLHAPFGYLFYASLGFLKHPVDALMAGCALSIVLYFAPLVWIHMRAGADSLLARTYACLACAAVVLASPGTNYSALNIHVDAPSIAAAVIAAGILATARGPVGNAMLACSAALGVFSVACKQTMIAVPVALACFLLLAEGPRRFLKYVLMQLVSVVVIGAATLALFRPTQDLIFNMYTWAVHLQRPIDTTTSLLLGMYTERLALAVVVPTLALLVAGILFDTTGSLRARLNSNRWVVFLFMAILQTPVAMCAWTTPGADVNHLGVITLFAALAVTMGLIMSPAIPAVLQRAAFVGIIVATLPVPWQLTHDFISLPKAPAEIAWRYEKLHPGRAYFPLNPLAALMAEGKPTHYDFALYDRERAGYAVTPEQFAAGLPAHYQLIAYPPNYGDPPSHVLAVVLRSMHPVPERGLYGWHVFGPGSTSGPSP
jgi:hypothetical protein